MHAYVMFTNTQFWSGKHHSFMPYNKNSGERSTYERVLLQNPNARPVRRVSPPL